MYIFSVYDSKLEAFLPPFFRESKGLAERAMMEAVASPEHVFSQWPGDYTLFCLGEWDHITGQFDAYPAQINMGTALIYKSQIMSMRNRSNGHAEPISDASPVLEDSEGGHPEESIHEKPRSQDDV